MENQHHRQRQTHKPGCPRYVEPVKNVNEQAGINDWGNVARSGGMSKKQTQTLYVKPNFQDTPSEFDVFYDCFSESDLPVKTSRVRLRESTFVIPDTNLDSPIENHIDNRDSYRLALKRLAKTTKKLENQYDEYGHKRGNNGKDKREYAREKETREKETREEKKKRKHSPCKCANKAAASHDVNPANNYGNEAYSPTDLLERHRRHIEKQYISNYENPQRNPDHVRSPTRTPMPETINNMDYMDNMTGGAKVHTNAEFKLGPSNGQPITITIPLEILIKVPSSLHSLNTRYNL